MAVQRCVDDYDWKSLQEKSSRMSDEEINSMLRDTPVAEMAAICYSEHEENYVISPDKRYKCFSSRLLHKQIITTGSFLPSSCLRLNIRETDVPELV